MKKQIAPLVAIWLLFGCRSGIMITPTGSKDLIRSNQRLLEIAMEDGFSPPVASRVYLYPHLAAHAILEQFYPDSIIRLTSHLQDFPQADSLSKKEADGRLTALIGFWLATKSVVFSEHLAQQMAEQMMAEAREHGYEEKQIEASQAYAKQFNLLFSEWIKKDRYAHTRTLERYTSSKLPQNWRETPPDYTPGLEPHWPMIRKLVLDSTDRYECQPLPAFSPDKNSAFHKLVMEVYSQSLDSVKIKTAWYWDDNPNVSRHSGHLTTMIHKISPPGHWLNITTQVCEKESASLWTTSDALTLCAMAMFDGLIDCWETKYRTDVVRPVSYINEYIDPSWRPLIQTPPFPEFTSGHSVVSAAAAEVLSQIFGSELAFNDSTEVLFGHPPRTYKNFHEAAMEVSMSRHYGGIHYLHSVLEGNRQGTHISRRLLDKIHYKPQSR